MSNFWDFAYQSLRLPDVPSQFAAFVANEIDPDSSVIDLGCGNGRDTFFFHSLGHQTIGVDESTSAINRCEDRAHFLNLQAGIQFINSDLNDYLVFQNTIKYSQIIFYSRFVYHSLSEAESKVFLQSLGNRLRDTKNRAFLEFRSSEDEYRHKETPDHFRRFESIDTFEKKCRRAGLTVLYSTEGIGYAKWKDDNAIVIRAELGVNL